MKTTFSHSQMLELWRIRLGLKPARVDCTIERVDGIDIDAMISRQMRQWYVDLLDTAPLELLAAEDISSKLSLMVTSDGCARFTLPENCRRLISVQLNSWHRPALVVAAHQNPRLEIMQANPYSRAGAQRPLAVVHGRSVHLYSADTSSAVSHKISSALAITDPGPDTFVLDERALSTIPHRLIPDS